MADRLYECAKNAIVMSLKSVAAVSLTMDGWTDRFQRKYTGVTLCGIDDAFVVHHFTVGLIPCAAPVQTAEHIVHDVTSCFESFLPENAVVATITSDNGANFKSARNSIVGPNDGIHCIIHGLQLCIMKVLDLDTVELPCASDINAVRTFVKSIRGNAVHRSTLANRSDNNLLCATMC